MLGLGAATRYAILRAQGDERVGALFLQRPALGAGVRPALHAGGQSSAPRYCCGSWAATAEIIALGVGYARIFLLFTPFFMCNYIVAAFVRNDGDPSLAMVATLCGSLFNVVFDYIFMFPMGLGLPGAALATAVSPVLSILQSAAATFFKKEQHRPPSCGSCPRRGCWPRAASWACQASWGRCPRA